MFRVCLPGLFIAIVLGLLPPRGRADEPVYPGSTVLSDPVFTAHMINGESFAGRIRQIDPKGAVTLVPAKGAERTLEFKTILRLAREGAVSATSPDRAVVLLPDGDRISVVIGPATDTTLEVQAYALGNLSIPLESILGLVLTPPDDADALDKLLDRVRNEPRSSEVVWLANGDRMVGGFLGLDEKKIKFQPKTGPLLLDRSGVMALGFDRSLVVYPKPAHGFFELTLSDGSRLGVQNPRVEQGNVVATTRFGASIRVPLGELVSLGTRSDAVVYLSERDAAAVQYVAYVGPTRPYRRDLSVDGHPLRLGGQMYDRGLGTQSRTLLAYRLSPGDRRFQAIVGVDDGAGPLGSVVFRVLVDKKERFVSPAMSVRDAPKAIDIDVAGASSIILVTEFGERGEVRDFADWVDARLIRQ